MRSMSGPWTWARLAREMWSGVLRLSWKRLPTTGHGVGPGGSGGCFLVGVRWWVKRRMKRRERKMRGKKTLDSAGIRDNNGGLMVGFDRTKIFMGMEL